MQDRKSYDRTYAIVDLGRVVENLRLCKEKLRKGMAVCAVVKMDAYGHGIVEVAKAIEDECAMFGVATVEEAITLRKAGIEGDILILGVIPESQYALLYEYRIMPSLFTLKQLKKLEELGKKNNTNLAVHIALDTGMGRIGIQTEEKGALKIAEQILASPYIEVKGIFSHFASCDEQDKSYARKQEQRFKNYLEKLKERGFTIPLCHIANSAGILEDIGTEYNMVRDGIVLYGVYPSKEVLHELPIKMALSWKAKISHIKTVPAGEGISYGSTFVTEKEMKIATIPVGYGDGYPRILSGKATVLVSGKKCPILGRVCMDQFMVDITGVEAELFQEVTLLGEEGGEEISLYDWEELGVFPYEFLCGLGNRVPRVYYRGKEWIGTYNPQDNLHLHEFS
jgi:alanine racemase